MFEITIKGITKQFESAAKMAEWQESMFTPSPRKSRKKEKKKGSLKNHIKKASVA